MSEIEKMKQYIERTNTNKADRYYLNYCEAVELGRKMRESDGSMLEIIGLIFEYGKAKGYRAAKAEARVSRRRKSLLSIRPIPRRRRRNYLQRSVMARCVSCWAVRRKWEQARIVKRS